MDFSPYLLLPLTSSVLYVFGALMLKRSSEFGVGVWRSAFVANIISGIVFMPLLLMGGSWPPWTRFWEPAVIALLFLAGQILSFLAITRGDVSVATPVMGSKMVLVALFVTWISASAVPLSLWVAAVLGTGAVALLNISRGGRHHHTGSTIFLAFLASVSFALFDVLVQRWAPDWGPGRMLPVMLGMVVLYSFSLIPFFNEPLRKIPKRAWPWLIGGCLFIAVQGLLLIVTLAVFGNATAVNVIYSTRGLWSVLLVWWVGHWFHTRAPSVPADVFRWRLAGAILMTVAVLLVFA